jgi:glycosyltransferase involved in cell wall biosynthesis
MKKVLFIIDTNVGGPGGAEQHLQLLAENFDYTKYKVHIIQLGKIVKEKEGLISGSTFTNIQTGRLLSKHGISQIYKILKHIKQNNYDVIFSYFESSDIISILSRYISRNSVHISCRRDTGFRHSNKINTLYKILNKRFNLILCASNDIQISVERSGVNKNKVKTIYNGVNYKRFTSLKFDMLRKDLKIDKSEIVLGMVANLSPVKNHAKVITTLAKLHNKGNKYHLVLVGDGILREELEGLVSNIGLGDYVHFLGRRTDIPDILAGIDIFILASKTEGLSNALLEAMAAKKPIIATKVGGNTEVVLDKQSGILVNVNDEDRLFDAILKLASSESLRKEYGNCGYYRILNMFSIDKMVSDYESIIDSI